MGTPKQHNVFNGDLNVGAPTLGKNSPAEGHVVAGTSAGGTDGRGDRRTGGTPRTLLLVATDVERIAVMQRVSANTDIRYSLRRLRYHTVYELGRIGGTEIMLAQVGPGTVTLDAAGVAAAALVDELGPDHLILTGICYGLRDDDARSAQRLGDVVVASQLRLIAHERVTQTDDGVRHTKRGGEVHPSPMLLDRLRSASHDWQGAATVHFGPVLSESVLVDSRSYRQHLKEREPEAIAGEMEGAGVYAAALRGKVDWALVKGICDWGYEKGDKHQRLAADNASSFVVHMIRTGGLDPVATA